MGLIMLDLDGTLVPDALEETVTATGTKLQRRQHELYTEPELNPNVCEILRHAAEDGDSFAIVTNQGGVAWGYHTQAEVYDRIGHTVAQLGCLWGRPFSVHIAWMMEKGNLLPQFKGDDGRKPAPTMLLAALEAHGLVTEERGQFGPLNALMVGDRDEDGEAAEAASLEFCDADAFFEVPF